MKDVIVIIAVTAVIVFGFFIMKRLDAFLEENRNAIEKEQEEQCSPLEFLDTDDYEKVISDIEKFKTTHEDIKLIIYDGKNDDLTDMIKLYNHTGM